MNDKTALDWKSLEDKYLKKRREAIDDKSEDTYVGLAFSGGGIRAATFSLGVLKSLSTLNLIKRFDYLSTVSGGGYVGAFYSSLIARSGIPVGSDNPLGTEIGKAAINHLRQHGRYLLPAGAGDAVRLVTTAIRGWIAIQLVIGVTLLAVLLSGKWLQAFLIHSSAIKWLDALTVENGWQRWASPSAWLRGYPLVNDIVLGPLWTVVALLSLITVALSWSYWLTRYEGVSRSRIRRFFGPSGLGAAAIAFACLVLTPGTGGYAIVFRLIGVLAVGAIIAFAVAETRSWYVQRSTKTVAGAAATTRAEEDRVRNRITRWTANVLSLGIATATLALIDTIGQTVYVLYLAKGSEGIFPSLTFGAIVGVTIPIIRRVITWGQTTGSLSRILRRLGWLIALVGGLSLALVLTSAWAVVAEYLAWRGGPIPGHSPSGSLTETNATPSPSTISLFWLAAGFIVAAIAIGLSIGFLNLSSFSAFYAGRLRRAYLGASNNDRTSRSMSAEHENLADDISLTDYYTKGETSGAPLHLINVTVNETMGHGSRLVQRDRKGRPLTVSPAGYLVPTDDGNVRHHALSDNGPSSTELPLSSWVAISGAAMSTGLGRNTSLGLALLAGLSNLRLGVWWTPPGKRGSGYWPNRWVQRFLAAEFFGRFNGIDGQRWYLTDGGHFENTGIYELVRRRVPLIVACDAGADPDYEFGDIVNLTRKLRIDFEADLDFLPADRLDELLGKNAPNRAIFGELSQLVRLSREKSSRGPYAAIGRIQIPGGSYRATLILLKPRITGMEMTDLLDYSRINQDFPQQTTGDQFFDEAQWESYFRLGITIGELAFTSSTSMTPAKTKGSNPTAWNPGMLKPVDDEVFKWFTDPWLRDMSTQPQARLDSEPDVDANDRCLSEKGIRPVDDGQEPVRLSALKSAINMLGTGVAAVLRSVGLPVSANNS